jgi:hypothetical protein
MKMILEHGPNVDLMYGQGNGTGYWEPPRCPKRQEVVVSTLAEASVAFKAWIHHSGLGGGNITHESGTVYKDGQAIARVSYNGRVWTPFEHGHPQHKEIAV